MTRVLHRLHAGRAARGSATVLAALVVCATLGCGAALAQPGSSEARLDQPPLFAYYYIWFNPTSWERAKTDYPVLGRYSSDERDVMRQHIDWAKEAGIEGFLVSWKSTDTLNRRLARLTRIAEEKDFKLAVIYQGLDFSREPLPAERIGADLDLFIERFASRRPFRYAAKPLVIWSGTWRFTTAQIASVTEPRRDRLLLLASEKNVQGYKRVADFVDGDAYYWSSVDPQTFPGYAEKLVAMSEAVHERAGYWIAPAAPGFDARLIGGTTVVERRDGETLRRQYDAAVSSSPDMVGLISWNEFSENSQVEPSEAHGSRSLAVLADMRGAEGPRIVDFDSSEPGGRSVGRGLAALVVLTVVMTGGAIAFRRRARSPV